MGIVKIDLRQLSSLSFEIIFLLIGFCLRDAQRAECGRGAICQCSGAHTFPARELCVERELRGQIAKPAPSHVCVPSSTLWRPPFVGSRAKLEEPMQTRHLRTAEVLGGDRKACCARKWAAIQGTRETHPLLLLVHQRRSATRRELFQIGHRKEESKKGTRS